MKEISKKFCKGHHIICLLIFIISCTAEKDNNLGLIIDDAYINLPLKGQMISVGYFKLSNNSNMFLFSDLACCNSTVVIAIAALSSNFLFLKNP